MRRVLLGALTCCLAVSASGQTTAPRMHLVEDLRIDGKKMGFDERPLAFLLVTPRGRMAYVDPYKFRVNFFDVVGRHVGDFGGRGTGPGQFGEVGANAGPRAGLTGGIVGDSIWLVDESFRGHDRVTYLSSQGDFLGTWERSDGPSSAARKSKEEPGPGLQLVGAYGDGGVLWKETFATSFRISTNENELSSRTDSTVFVRTPKNSESERTLLRVPADRADVTVGELTLRAPFAGSAKASVAPDGGRIATVTWRATTPLAGTIALIVINSKGDTIVARRYPFNGTTIDLRTADNLVAQSVHDHDYLLADGTHRISARDADEFRRKLRAAVPLSRSPVAAVHFGVDNSIWMSLPRTPGGAPWLVLDEKGEPFASVTLPTSAGRLSQMSKSSVWVIEQPKDGPPSIVRYKLVPGAY